MNWNQSNNNLFMKRISFRRILHYGSGLQVKSEQPKDNLQSIQFFIIKRCENMPVLTLYISKFSLKMKYHYKLFISVVDTSNWNYIESQLNQNIRMNRSVILLVCKQFACSLLLAVRCQFNREIWVMQCEYK